MAIGVTDTVPEIGAFVAFVVLKAGICEPVPPIPKPMAGFELVQLHTVPLTELLNGNAAIDNPAQRVVSVKSSKNGVGLTVIVKLWVFPLQKVGAGPALVTVITAVIGVFPGLVAVKLGILPFPEEANPILGSELVHENEVFATELTKIIGNVAALSQTVTSAGSVRTGIGLIQRLTF